MDSRHICLLDRRKYRHVIKTVLVMVDKCISGYLDFSS